ncbi:MAG: class I SAM-dependent methyltransferase [Anaerolineales bacterium]|nr:class I SAM-dependent methyltransferase [Anaerolineales bacterium]
MTEFDRKAKDWDQSPVKTERAQAVAGAVARRVPLSRGMRALEYGCGTGLLSFALRRRLGRITLADSSEGMLAVLSEKIAGAGIRNMFPLRLDLTTDPPPPERYGLIYSLMALHHIPDTAGILRAFFSLLEENGFACIADLDSEDGSFHGGGFDGHRGFDRGELQALAVRAGFRKVAFDTVFRMRKQTERGVREFPLFLMTAEKPGGRS